MRSVYAVIGALFRPWRDTKTWWGLVHLGLDVFIGIATFIPLVILLAMSVGFLIVFPLAVPCIWFLFLVGRIVGTIERSRFAALLGEDLQDPVPPLKGTNPWARLKERMRSLPRWREIAYGILRLPMGMLTTMSTLWAWSGSAALLFLPLYVNGLPEDTAHFGLFDVRQGAGALGMSLVGLVGLLLAAPWLTHLLVRLDVTAARWLLALSREEEIDEQVTRLETSRVAAVDSAEAERRRIERDLHDGAQQRLVSLAMGLGAAKERLESDPERGRQLVAEAHEEAKAALKDIRDLVRGIHPVILEDRGLDPALSAVVARSPVPVHLSVEMAERPSPAVESTAYFVVTEALTNIARHAHADEARVNIVRAGDRLVIEVSDSGIGGADSSRGSGLQGLRNRVAALGGTMHVVSPDGGPTSLLVEIPC